MKDLVLHIAKGLVDKPEAVELSVIEQGETTQLMIKVAEEDKGKVIGKQGKVIKAIRAVASAAAEKTGRKVVVDIE